MAFSSRKRNRYIACCIGALTSFLAANFIVDPHPNGNEPLFAIDAWCYDRLLPFRTRSAVPSREIFVLGFDDITFEGLRAADELSAQWPWSPRLFTQVIRRLHQLGVTAIGIDKLFIEPHILNLLQEEVSPEQEMADACREHGKVVIASKFESHIIDASTGVHLESLALPLPIFRQTEGINLGFISLPKDSDGRIRRAYLYREHQNTLYPSFSAELYRLIHGLDSNPETLEFLREGTIGDIQVPLYHETFYIDFVPSEKSAIQTFPFLWFTDPYFDMMFGETAELFPSDPSQAQPAFELERLKNSIVLMGATTGELHDVFDTPISPILPGVEIHAHVLQTLLSGRPLHHLDDRLQIAGMIVSAVVICLLCALAPMRIGIPLTALGILSGIAFASFMLVYGGWVMRIATPSVILAVSAAMTLSYRYIFEEREKRYLKQLFSKATDAQLVDQLLENPEQIKLGGDRRTVTILFSDIRSFSSLSEHMEPEILIDLLNEYFSAVTDVIFRHHGMIDKFIGDAVMAIFGAPLPDTKHALSACHAAVDMLKAQHKVSQSWQAKGHAPFRIGIGIHTGQAVFGNLGSEKRSNYTCIGDAVNVASRIEGLNKEFHTEILISEDTYKECTEMIKVKEVGQSPIRGRQNPVLLYELLSINHDDPSHTETK